MCNIISKIMLQYITTMQCKFCPLPCVPMSGTELLECVHIKCIVNYTHEVSLVGFRLYS